MEVGTEAQTDLKSSQPSGFYWHRFHRPINTQFSVFLRVNQACWLGVTFIWVCVCDDDGWQGQDRACQQTSAISFGSGLFHIAQTPIHLTKHPTEPTWSPEGATVSRSRALWCLHRGIIHLHWLDRGNTCSETDAQRVYLSFRFQFHVSFLQEGWKGGPSWGYIKREPLFWLLSEIYSTNTSQKESECWPRNILIHLFITWFRLYSVSCWG